MVLGAVRKVSEPAMRSGPVSTIPLHSQLQLPSPDRSLNSCLEFLPTLRSLRDVQCDLELSGEINALLHKMLLVVVFITEMDTRTRTKVENVVGPIYRLS